MNFKILSMFLLYSASLYSYNAEQLRVLLNSLNSKKKDRQTNFSRCDFRGIGAVLKGADLRTMELSGILFDKISDNVIPQASLVKNPGQRSDLTGVNFSNCQLVSTSFKGAILKGANLSNTDISYANFTDADLTGVIGLETAKNSHLACFCGAIMPDGKKPTGSTWTSPSTKKYPKGKIFNLHCAPPSAPA